MQRVHFIAIGGAAMHNLAIAVSKKGIFQVTGSDDEIFEPSYSRLKTHNLLPEKIGWFPERIQKGLQAVVVGQHAKVDNPELLRAKELGLKIYSFPEYLFQQTRSKTRIVVAGTYGKTTITAMILFVLKQLRIEADYMLSSQIDGYDNLVKLTFDSRIAVFEGDEYLTSPIDSRPKFHLYKPHIAVLTGIAWDHINVFPSFEAYTDLYRSFTDLMEMQGRLVYFEGDKNLNAISKRLRRDIVAFPYKTPDFEFRNGITFLKTKKSEVSLKIFGEHNLQNLNAARLACKQIGVTDEQFYSIIENFPGVSGRLQLICKKGQSVIYKDAANSPSTIKAAVKAMKNQFPSNKLIACFELNSTSNLTDEFMPLYTGCLDQADVAYIYFDTEMTVEEQQNIQRISQVQLAFGGANLVIVCDLNEFKSRLREIEFNNISLLFMNVGSSTDFNTLEFSKELLKVN